MQMAPYDPHASLGMFHDPPSNSLGTLLRAVKQPLQGMIQLGEFKLRKIECRRDGAPNQGPRPKRSGCLPGKTRHNQLWGFPCQEILPESQDTGRFTILLDG